VVQKTQNAVILLLSCCLLIGSCTKKKGKLATVDVNVAVLPQSHTEDVVSLVSDSGITRYRLTTKVWDVFDDYMLLPKGIYVEKFDEKFAVISTIKADTAYYYIDKGLVRLIGHVDIKTQQGDRIETSELYWNRLAPPFANNAIYSDSLTKITQNGNLTITHGFKTSNQMDTYVMYRNSTEFPEEQFDKKPE
jgi:LPS export ABC transporter protein LptC